MTTTRTLTCPYCEFHGKPHVLILDCYERWYCPECGRNAVDGEIDPTWKARGLVPTECGS